MPSLDGQDQNLGNNCCFMNCKSFVPKVIGIGSLVLDGLLWNINWLLPQIRKVDFARSVLNAWKYVSLDLVKDIAKNRI